MNQCQSNIYLEAEEGEHCPEVQRERQELAHRYEIAYAQQCAHLTGKRIPVPGPTIYLGTGLLEDILYQLTALMEKREHELLLAGAGATQASMSVTQTQTLTTTITYTQTIKQVNEMPADILTMIRSRNSRGCCRPWRPAARMRASCGKRARPWRTGCSTTP